MWYGSKGDGFVTHIKEMRQHLFDRHISFTQLSIDTGISLTKISLVMNGKRDLSMKEYGMICWALGVDTNYFFKPITPDFLKDVTKTAWRKKNKYARN